MLSLFKPRPPLTPGQRVNLELLVRRTFDAIGRDLPKSCTIPLKIDDLGIRSDSSLGDLEATKTAVGRQFPHVDVTLETAVTNNLNGGISSNYRGADGSSPASIQIHVNLLKDPLRTVVEFSNQYSTHYWHGTGLIACDEIHPNLSHLLPVCCGFGVLVSDAAFYDSQSSDGGWHHWSMSRVGFYNSTEIGYASALMARVRGERFPDWIRAMRLDARDTAKQAFRYFEECDRNQRPILFDAERIPGTTCNPSELSDWLVGRDPTFALAAGYALIKQGKVTARVTEAAMEAARGSNRELVPIAIKLLGRTNSSGDQIRSLVQKAIANRNNGISIAAIEAASELGIPLSMYRNRIASHLESFAEGSGALVGIVAKGGSESESFGGLIAQHLGEAVLYSNETATAALTDCLSRICDHPKAMIEREIGDPDLRERVLSVWNDFPSRE